MKLRTKLFSSIVMFCLTIVTLMVGVWAVNSASVSMGGTLSFIAPGVEATISQGTMANGEWKNSADANTKLKEVKILKDDTESTLATKLAPWSGINLNFNENGDDITITFTITNDSSSKYLSIGVTTSYTSADNCTIEINTSSVTLDAGASQSFTLTMKITEKDLNATMTNFAVVFNMQLSDTKPTSVDLTWDDEGEYWYVTMGHTDTISEIRWRLVGVNGTRYTSSTKPSAGTQGTFILETPYISTTNSKFNTSTSDGNDYATSLIRTYLKGDYVTALNLTNDETYKAIAPRSVSELYENMAWRVDDNNQVEDCTLPSGATGEDSLWLMSVAEAYTLLGGGTITDDIIDSDWEAYCDNLAWDYYYWLRSPIPRDSDDAFGVYSDGYWTYYGVDATSGAVRPAFNLNF